MKIKCNSPSTVQWRKNCDHLNWSYYQLAQNNLDSEKKLAYALHVAAMTIRWGIPYTIETMALSSRQAKGMQMCSARARVYLS